MPDTDIGEALEGGVRNVIVDYSVDSQSLDGAGDADETTWQMTNWEENLGYYKTIPELQTAIDAKAVWTMGAGFTADDQTELLEE